MPRIVAFLAIFLVLFPLPAAAGIVTGPEIQLTTPVVEPPFFSQAEAQLTTDGDGFLAVWTEESAETSAIHGARVEAGGARIDETPLILASTPHLEHSADLAWGGGHYFVVWSE